MRTCGYANGGVKEAADPLLAKTLSNPGQCSRTSSLPRLCWQVSLHVTGQKCFVVSSGAILFSLTGKSF